MAKKHQPLGEHATAPSYVRERRQREAQIARAEKQEARRGKVICSCGKRAAQAHPKCLMRAAESAPAAPRAHARQPDVVYHVVPLDAPEEVGRAIARHSQSWRDRLLRLIAGR